MHDADREPDVLTVVAALQAAVSQRDVLAADALEAEVGVSDPQVVGPLEGRVGERPHREREEGGIDLGGHPAIVAELPAALRPSDAAGASETMRG